MKLRLTLIIFLSVMLDFTAWSQGLIDKTLMTVAGKAVPAGEFIRMYNKSAEPGKQNDIDTYLQQYITFKCKVADAISLGMDTTRAFKTELGGYRDQLAQNYLTDIETKEKLLQKTYQRSLTEINAWHILVSCPEGAKPEDTLNAWQKASDIRKRIINGESFEEVARSSSDDPSVKINGGNLGYFTVFQMIMPFEDEAYRLKKGAVSEPVRTPYGYHIIKVADKRPSKGKILVAHIMKTAPPGADEADVRKAKEATDSIYQKLLGGASFSELAARYSDHNESAAAGGKLNWFGAGEIIPDFSEAAFSIADTGKYTKPVRTVYGWHIIKLLDKKPPGTYEETKSYLESRLNQSYLNSVSKKSFIDRLKKEYRFSINEDARNWFIANTDTMIIRGLLKYNRTEMPSGNIYSFAGQHLTTKDFATYIERRSSIIATNDPVFFINQTIEAKAADQVFKYENSVLEKKYPDFRFLMNEFHDGILLFEISGLKVWNRVQNDSLGLKQYYEEHKKDFLTKKGIEAKVYTLRSAKDEKKFNPAFKKYSGKPETDRLMLKKFNRENDSLLVINERKYFSGDDPAIDKLDWTLGPKYLNINGFPEIILIQKIIDPEPLPFVEVQGEMMTRYQDFLENEWLKQLKEKYTVKIDNQVYDEVKKNIKNE
jgi:peptidyl-prolyl cis-trans isomerase SurA